MLASIQGCAGIHGDTIPSNGEGVLLSTGNNQLPLVVRAYLVLSDKEDR